MKLLIGADLVPTKTNTELFAQGAVETLFGDKLLQLLQSAQYRVFNLETPVTDNITPIDKCGPALRADTNTVAAMKAMGVDLFAISNNHILDHGTSGLQDTMQTLSDNQIAYVGAGDNLQAATKAYFAEVGGKKIGIYACCEHEFSVATEKTAGANPFDPLESLDHIAQAKTQCDYLVVLFHGGKEYYRYPSPNTQKICRKMVQKGANLVICQHTHCIGCKEEYENGTIVYGQGNFIFDDSNREPWLTGLLVAVDDDLKASFIPLEKKGNTVRLAEGAVAEEILGAFEARSNEIKDQERVKQHYQAFISANRVKYLAAATGKESFFFKAANKLLKNKLREYRVKRRYDKKAALLLQNYVECETHREVLLGITRELVQ